jgi:rSAM/selenodomain-associated transferase 2
MIKHGNSGSFTFKNSSHSTICRYSIVIPVLHEGDNINKIIDYLQTIDEIELSEIIVVDGSPERDTIQKIRSDTVMSMGSEKGRAVQMNAGSRVARGEILLFLHADVIIPRNALSCIGDVIAEEKYAGGAFELGIDSEKFMLKLIERFANFRTSITGIPYGDQAIFIRKKIFHEIGDFREIPIMEDIEMMERIHKSGHSIKIIPRKVISSPRRWGKEGAVYGTLRNWYLRLLYHMGVEPESLIKNYKDN